jgi:peptidoglycan/xylan/chitin deacetylase (PgdA/CDA1 family)
VSLDQAGDRERDALLTVLDSASTPVCFWWRDDDAQEVTPQLERLLALRRRHGIPLALAVIPAHATIRLAERVGDEPGVVVLQHGWQHGRHAPAGAKEAEFGDHRPLPEMLAELNRGRQVMERLFPTNFLPILVPPWNRVGESVRKARHEAGLPGISGFRQRPPADPHTANAHVDPIAWMSSRSALSREELFRYLRIQTEARLAGTAGPIGILSHHLVHDEPVWELLDEVLESICNARRAEWPAIRSIFGLTQPHHAPSS